MNVIILAAGKGTRMKHLTKNMPKSMLKINGRYILEHTLENLPDEINNIYIIIGHFGNKIKDYFGNDFKGKKIIYIEEKENYARGTAAMMELVKGIVFGKMLVLMGDDLYSKGDLEEMVKVPDWAVLAQKVNHPENVGVLKFDNDNHVIDIIERPKEYVSNFANTGAYLIDDRFFNYPLFKLKNGEYGLPQTIITASVDIPLKMIRARFWHSNNKPSDLKKAEKIVIVNKYNLKN